MPLNFFARCGDVIEDAKDEAADGVDVGRRYSAFDVEVQNELGERVLAVNEPGAVGALGDGIIFSVELGYIAYQRLEDVVHSDHSKHESIFVRDKGVV